MNTMRHLLAAALLATLAACTGGAPTTVNPNTTPPTVADYTGPAPATADVQSFRINLWENIKANNRCGGCHNATGQTPAVRAQRRREPGVCRCQHGGQPDPARPVAHGDQGRRRPQLLAVQQPGLRRHPDHLDPQLGRLGCRWRHADPAAGAGGHQRGFEQVVPRRVVGRRHQRQAVSRTPSGRWCAARAIACAAIRPRASTRSSRRSSPAPIPRTRPTPRRARRSTSTTRPTRACTCASRTSRTTAGPRAAPTTRP